VCLVSATRTAGIAFTHSTWKLAALQQQTATTTLHAQGATLVNSQQNCSRLEHTLGGASFAAGGACITNLAAPATTELSTSSVCPLPLPSTLACLALLLLLLHLSGALR
jgi:hypothetical protein